MKKSLLSRVAHLWRAFWGLKVDGVEAERTEAVYYNAIRQRKQQLDDLRQASIKLVSLRNRLEAEQLTQQRDLTLVQKALERAAQDDNESRGLELLALQRQLQEKIEKSSSDRRRLEQQCILAKESKSQLYHCIQSLEREREEMLARKSHAQARLDIKSALETPSFQTGGDEALNNARQAVAELESLADSAHDDPQEGQLSLRNLRANEQRDQDRETFATLRKRYHPRELPPHQQRQPEIVLDAKLRS